LWTFQSESTLHLNNWNLKIKIKIFTVKASFPDDSQNQYCS
jgi:hypothetical protein